MLNISFYYNQFLNKTIAIIHVLPLSYDKKYLSFESIEKMIYQLKSFNLKKLQNEFLMLT